MNVMPWMLCKRGAIVVAVAATVMLVACGGGKSVTPTATPAVQSTPEATGTAVYGTPIATPPTALPVPKETADRSEGIGVYPSMLGFADTLRGREYFSTVGVQNGGPTEHTYRFEAIGATASWLSFVSTDRTTPLTEVDIKPRDSAQVLVKAIVPDGVPNGDYGGVIRVLTTTTNRTGAQTSGSSVTIGAEVNVFLAVTGTQRIEGQFVDAGASDVESGHALQIESSLVNSGNVQMTPTINVEIVDASGAPVDHLTSSDQVLNPGERKQVITQWDTTGKPLGERVGQISVKIGDIDLGTKQVRFKILPVGTYTRRGELQDVHLTNTPRLGDLAKLVAVFKNTGQIETKGKFLGELYIGDRLIAQLSSAEQLLPPGGSGDLEILTRITENGTYTVKGKVNYEGRETDAQQFTFKVGTSGGTSVLTWVLVVAGAAAAAGIIGAGGWLARRRWMTGH